MSDFSENENSSSEFEFGVTSVEENAKSDMKANTTPSENSSSEFEFGVTSVEENAKSDMKANTTPSEDSETFEVISSASSTSFPSAKNTDSNIQINEQTSSISNRIRKLLRHRQSIDSSKTSPLFVKLQDANLRWWNSFHSQPEILRKDVQSTTKRIGLRLDKTQYLAVDNSNQIRSSIKNMKTCSSVIDNVIDCSKAILPTFKVCKLNAN